MIRIHHIPQAALIAALGATLATAALADCPSAADLADGVVLTRTEPFYSNVMTATDQGLTEARIMVVDGTPEEVASVYSHSLTVTQRIGASGTLGLDYADDTAILDTLIDIGSWTTDVTLLVDGTPQVTGTYTARFMDTAPLTLGACTYETWHVRTSLALEGRAPILQDRYFAPTLGLAIATVTLDIDGNVVSGVFFAQIRAQ